MDSAYGYLIGFLGLFIGIFVAFGFYIAKELHKHVEEALKNATDEEQTEIRNKVVKAMFPPRFPRN